MNQLSKPFVGEHALTQAFGEHPASYKRFGLAGHNGLDYAMPVGTRVLAVDDGRVSKLALDPNGLGVYAKITHDWGESLYAHLSFHTIWLGAIVGRGQQIGVSGNTGNSTGPHLHFGIRPFPLATGNGYNGYIDPAPYLTLEGVDVAAATNIIDVPAAADTLLATSDFTLDAYQQEALRTWNPSGDKEADLAYLFLSLSGEAGEAANRYKKEWRHGHEKEPDKLQEECGDVLWHVAVICNELGFTLGDTAARNRNKLRKRYSEGFSEDASRNREE